MCRVRYLPAGIGRGGPVGPPATLNRKPRQARKGATVVVTACAGMWLSGPPPFQTLYFYFGIFHFGSQALSTKPGFSYQARNWTLVYINFGVSIRSS